MSFDKYDTDIKSGCKETTVVDVNANNAAGVVGFPDALEAAISADLPGITENDNILQHRPALATALSMRYL